MDDLGPRGFSAAQTPGIITPEQQIGTTSSLDLRIQYWEPEILRAAKARGVSYDATQDLAQAARIRLAGAIARDPTITDFYIRRVIVNAMHDEFRANRVIDDPVLISLDGDEESADEVLEVVDNRPLASDSFYDGERVKHWLSTLSERERRIADLLWVQDVSERTAAAILGISKTRLHQLKEEILRRGQNHLIALSA